MADLPPLKEPLTVEAVMTNLKVDDASEGTGIDALISTAREYVEDQTGLVLTTPRLVTETARELGPWIELLAWPVISVEQVRYPVGSDMTPLAGSAWATSLRRRPVRLVPAVAGWGVSRPFAAPALPVEIDVIAGYADPVATPMRAKQAMHLLIAHWYANRSAVESGARAAAIEVPFGVAELLRGLRLVRV